MDQLLSIIVDAEVLYTTLGLQKDKFIKKIYSFLFTFLHQCVAERKPAIIQGPLGDPEKSFEKPSIQKIIKNFVILKYDKLRENNEAEFKVIMEVARTFLNCYNNWDFPNDCKDANAEENFYKIEYVQRSTNENLLMLIEFVFLFSYTRWLVFCYVPSFCNSLKYYNCSEIFGKRFLLYTFPFLSQQFLSHYEIGENFE
jgi:histone acetyltransferase